MNDTLLLIALISLALTIYFFWLLSNIHSRLKEIRDALQTKPRPEVPYELRNQPSPIPFVRPDEVHPDSEQGWRAH